MKTIVFGGRHVIEGFETLLPAVARLLEAAERKLDAATGAVTINENLAGADAFCHAVLACAIPRPDAGDEAEISAVGKADRFFLAFEGKQRENRPENLFLGNSSFRIDRSEQNRSVVIAARRSTLTDGSLCQDGDASLLGRRDHAGHALLLPRIDQRAEVEIGIMRSGQELGKTAGQVLGNALIDRTLDQDAAAG